MLSGYSAAHLSIPKVKAILNVCAATQKTAFQKGTPL